VSRIAESRHVSRIAESRRTPWLQEWHVIIMTKKLYDKREELRAIFGRDSIKRVFKNWVDYVFVMVQAAPVAGIVAGNDARQSVRGNQ